MKGILVVAHGSKHESVDDPLVLMVKMLKEKFLECEVIGGCIGAGEKSLVKQLDYFRLKGISEIIVVPYFLFRGIHIRRDIPEMLEEYSQTYPEVTIKLGETLGADKRLADILEERIRTNL